MTKIHQYKKQTTQKTNKKMMARTIWGETKRGRPKKGQKTPNLKGPKRGRELVSFIFWWKITKTQHLFFLNKIFSHKCPFLGKQFAWKGHKIVLLGRVSPHICLLAIVLRVPWNKIASRIFYATSWFHVHIIFFYYSLICRWSMFSTINNLYSFIYKISH